jgi:hypothetical protein
LSQCSVFPVGIAFLIRKYYFEIKSTFNKMNQHQDYIQDIAEIRSMMERSTKFLSLSGWAGILAGVYAIAGAWIAYTFFDFNPDEIVYSSPQMGNVALLALMVLLLALVTAVYFSWKKGDKQGEKIWNATSRRLLVSMAVPLVTGGILIGLLILRGLTGLIAPLSLLFYGLALYNAGTYTIKEVKMMGIVQICLGLSGSWFIGYGLIIWVAGFGVVHIIYGLYMYFRYER